ncbi:MAG: very short patch repair endonuclease [Gammaproteobacteria bacterium]
MARQKRRRPLASLSPKKPTAKVPRGTSFRMSRVRHWDTEPELNVRRLVRKLGFHFQSHVGRLPGRPDIVIPEHGVVIRVHGCFWHGHSCRRGRLPATNRSFWRKKIERNRLRDRQTGLQLRRLGWKVLTVWECQVKDLTVQKLARRLRRPERRPTSRSKR